MISTNAALPGFYNYGEVARSVVIAIAASYAALDLAGRVTTASGRVRVVWLSGGAIAMGIGIWAMHFKGMLAFHLPVPVKYHWPTVLASLVVAIFASAFALYVVSPEKTGRVQALTGSLIMGAGIAGMHYIGMAAMRLPAVTRFSPFLVACSILLAIVFSLVALQMAFGLREETRWTIPRRLASATVMGAAVSAMHYTGMAAASFIPASLPDLSRAVSMTPVGSYAVVLATLIVLVVAIVTSSVDRRRSEDRLRLVIETAPAMLHSARPDGYVDFFNKRWLEYVGASLEEIWGWQWTNVIHPEDVEYVVSKWRSSVATGTPFEAEARFRRADGEYRLMLLRKVPLRDEAGSIVEWYGSATDIEDRKRAEDELRRQKEVFQKIFENIPVTISFVGQDGQIALVNPEWERTIGWTLEEMRKQNLDLFAELYPDPQYRQRVLDLIAASTGEWTDRRVTVRDGRVIDWAVAVVHLSDGTSVAIGRDVTEQKSTEAALQEAQYKLAQVTRTQAMGELAAAIAHEVNQPLTAIVTNGSFSLRQLESATPNPDELRAAITEIVSDGTRASAVISRIRGLLMKGTPVRAELNINHIIHDVSILLRNDLSRNHVSLRTDLAADLPHVPGDSVQLQQVLINLIMNAVEAMRISTGRTRELLIKSAKDPDGILVQVQDSGPGIAPEVADRIFEPFFTTKAEGIGMGLSISRSIVESHGGRLWVVAEPNGALFEFTVPTQD
jgi:PAS domain S-box-containing protein